MPLPTGSKLGPYEILGAAGAGGMGEVYKARDTRLERTVAVKILPDHLSTDARLRQRFEREARAVSSLNHPQICVLYDVGQHEGTDYIVMEYLEGETLAQRLERGPLPLAEVLSFGIQIADALDKAHRQGVVHRDLKPGNIMLTPTGAKLMDFGLAKSAAPLAASASWTMVPTQTSPVTQQGTIVGTFQYMSPEQVEGGEVDARTDIFAFGAVLYEMVTGRRAFQGKSTLSVASAVLEKDPEPITAIAPLTPPALDRTIRKCLAKNPDDRWQTARDLLLELKWIAEAGSQAGVPAVVAKRRRIHEAVWMAATAALLLVAATLAWMYYREANREAMVVRAFVPPPEKGTYAFVGGANVGPVAVSPDGRTLAFSAVNAEGHIGVYVRAIDAAVATPLAGTEGGTMPFWSPDGRKLGFFVDGKLKKIDAGGGPAIALCDTTAVPRGGAWGAAGVIVFAPGTQGGLVRVQEGGGECTEVTKLDASMREGSHRWPQFLPDGQRFLFFARVGAPGTSSPEDAVMVGSIDGRPHRVLMRAQSNAQYASGYLLYMREASLMAQAFDEKDLALGGEAVPIAERVQRDLGASLGIFAASQNGVLAYSTGQGLVGSVLEWFELSGKQNGAVGERAYHLDASLSPDGRKVAASIVDERGGAPDIWIYDARGIRSRFTFDPGADRWPVWSPDGKQIVFNSNRNQRHDLYIKPEAGTGNEELLLATDLAKTTTDWSADGKYILYESRDPKSQSDLWALPLEGERKPIAVLQTQFREGEAVFSPDGRWIAYASDESGKFEIYVMPFPGGGRKWQISTAGGTRPRWPKRGKEIFFLGPGDKVSATEYAVQGDTFAVGRSRSLFDVRPSRPGTLFDMSADGKRVLVNTSARAQSADPVTLVINWTVELERKTSVGR